MLVLSESRQSSFVPAVPLRPTPLRLGMIGGPTGFEGSERYQYGADTPEGRAIEAAKAFKAAGVDKIVLGLSDGSIGQLTQPFPAGAPSIKDLWEKETGITLEIVGVPNGQEFTKTMQDISTKGGAYDIYAVEWNRLGDLAETGGIVKLDDFVAKHKPEWDNPENGYVGGAKGVSLLNQYRGSTYGVSLDGDFQTWVYRTDLFSDAAEQKAFKDKYGYDLAPPKTWKQLDEIVDLLPPPRQGHARLHRPPQPRLGVYELVPALRFDGLAERFPVRRRRKAAHQFGSRREGDPGIHRLAGIQVAGRDLLGLARAVRQLRQGAARQ